MALNPAGEQDELEIRSARRAVPYFLFRVLYALSVTHARVAEKPPHRPLGYRTTYSLGEFRTAKPATEPTSPSCPVIYTPAHDQSNCDFLTHPEILRIASGLMHSGA